MSSKSASNLLQVAGQDADRPRIQIGLKYDALIGNLYVHVIKCSNVFDLASPDKTPSKSLKNSRRFQYTLQSSTSISFYLFSSLATFVKVILKLEKNEIKHQTAVKKSTSNPVFDEHFELSLATYQVALSKLAICVYSKKLLSGKSLLGCILFGKLFFSFILQDPSYFLPSYLTLSISFHKFHKDEQHEDQISHLREAITNEGDNVIKWHYLN